MHVVFFRILKLFFITGFLLQYLGNWYRTNGPLVDFTIFNTSNKNKGGDINSPWNLLVCFKFYVDMEQWHNKQLFWNTPCIPNTHFLVNFHLDSKIGILINWLLLEEAFSKWFCLTEKKNNNNKQVNKKLTDKMVYMKWNCNVRNVKKTIESQ